MRFTFSNVSLKEREIQMGKSEGKVIFYFFLLLAVTVANNIIPKFGLADDFLEKSHYFDQIKSRDIFTDKPYVPICMGFIYYSLPVVYLIYRSIKKIGNKNRIAFQQN